MKYPNKFIEDVKAEFPDWIELHQALDEGNVFVGRYLDDSGHGSGPTARDVVDAFDKGEQNKLYDEAKRTLRINELYSRWGEIYQEERHLKYGEPFHYTLLF